MIINIVDCGATPDNPDNATYIQKALDQAAANGDTVLVPADVFKTTQVLPRSNTTLTVDGTLKAIGVNTPNTVVAVTNGVSNVTVNGGGSIVGERNFHPPGGNRVGFCVAVLNASGIKVGGGLTLSSAWADGLYVQDARDVNVNKLACVGNARNGMSIISGERISVTDSLFTLTNSESPYPQAGIDIEPDFPDQRLLDIMITRNKFIKNKGAGVYIAFQPSATRARVQVVANTFDQHYKDGSGPCIGGRNTTISNLLYATCRWIPGYDYWGYPTEFTC